MTNLTFLKKNESKSNLTKILTSQNIGRRSATVYNDHMITNQFIMYSRVHVIINQLLI